MVQNHRQRSHLYVVLTIFQLISDLDRVHHITCRLSTQLAHIHDDNLITVNSLAVI